MLNVQVMKRKRKKNWNQISFHSCNLKQQTLRWNTFLFDSQVSFNNNPHHCLVCSIWHQMLKNMYIFELFLWTIAHRMLA